MPETGNIAAAHTPRFAAANLINRQLGITERPKGILERSKEAERSKRSIKTAFGQHRVKLSFYKDVQ